MSIASATVGWDEILLVQRQDHCIVRRLRHLDHTFRRHSNMEKMKTLRCPLGSSCDASCVLAHLAFIPSVAQIICLNHPDSTSDPKTRQLRALRSKSIDIDPDSWSKVQVFHSNAALSLLGLNETEYTHIQDRVMHILHNAWPMVLFVLLYGPRCYSFLLLRSLANILVSTKRPWSQKCRWKMRAVPTTSVMQTRS